MNARELHELHKAGHRDFRWLNVSGEDLSYLDFRDSDWTGANLSGITAPGLNLEGANLSGVNLSHARMDKCVLKHATLVEAQMEGISAVGANLSDASLRRANFCNASLAYANLASADLREARLIKATLWRADLSRADLSSSDLSSAVLNDAKMECTTVDGTNFENACLDGAWLRGTATAHAKSLWSNTRYVNGPYSVTGSFGLYDPVLYLSGDIPTLGDIETDQYDEDNPGKYFVPLDIDAHVQCALTDLEAAGRGLAYEQAQASLDLDIKAGLFENRLRDSGEEPADMNLWPRTYNPHEDYLKAMTSAQ